MSDEIRLILWLLAPDFQFVSDGVTSSINAEGRRIYENRTRFYEQLVERKEQKKGKNVVSLSKTEYDSIVKKLKDIRAGTIKPSESDRYNMKRFSVMECEIQGRIISRLYKPNTMIKYVCDEELFDEIHEIHITKGHGGRDILKAAVKERFANITQEVLMIYLSGCEPCSNKKSQN